MKWSGVNIGVTFTFDGLVFDEGFRVGQLVDDRVVLELKSVE